MTFTIIVKIFLEFFSAIVIKDYFQIFFQKKKLKTITKAVCWMGYIWLQVFLSRFHMPLCFNITFNYGLILALVIFLYYGRITKKLLMILVFCLLWMIIEVFVGYIFMIIKPQGNVILLGSFTSKMGVFVCVQLITLLYRKDNIYNTYKIGDWINAVIIPICSIFIIHSLFMLSVDSNIKNTIFAIISSFAILALNVLTIKIYNKLGKNLTVEKENLLYEQQLELCGKGVLEMQNAFYNYRNISHDIKYHLICIYEMAGAEKCSAIQVYVNKLLDGLKIQKGICNCGNPIIDTLIDHKYNLMLEKKIPFRHNISSIEGLNIEDGDLCIILGNSLDNAIEASERIDDRSGYIEFQMIYRKGMLSIVVKNKYVSKLKLNVTGIYETTKREKNMHGIGLQSMSKVVDKYDGEMIIDASGAEFVLKIILYEKC